MYHIFGAFVYVCACIIWAVLPGLWIRSRSFTERALTTPPTWRRNPGGKAVNVKKGYSWNTQNGDGGIIQKWHRWPTGILANVMKRGELLYWTFHTELKILQHRNWNLWVMPLHCQYLANRNTRLMQRYRDLDTVGDRLFYWITTLLNAIHQDLPVDVSDLTSGNKMLIKAKRCSFTYNLPTDILHANT